MNKKYTLAELLPQSVQMPVTHPTLGTLDLTIKVTGQFSSSAKAKAYEAFAWLQNAQKETDPAKLNTYITKFNDISNESAAAAICGWSDDEALGGAYSPEYALSLMKRPDMEWLRKQVTDFVSEQNNFFRKAD